MNPAHSRPLLPWLLAAPAVALIASCFLLPLALLVRVSFLESAGREGFYRSGTWSVRGYSELLGGGLGRRVIAFTVALGVGVAVLAVLLAYPLAYFICSLPRSAKRLALAAVLLPKLANVFVVLYGLNLLLGNTGPMSRAMRAWGTEPVLLTHNVMGVVIAETYLILPYAILVLVLALERIEPELIAAARGLGAGPWGAFARVTGPLSLPGVVVAAQLSLIWALGAFVGPLLLGGPDEATLGVMVQKWGHEDGNWPRAAATAVLSLVTVAVCLAILVVPVRWVRAGGMSHA